MLTRADKQTFEAEGLITRDRLEALKHALRTRASDAQAMSYANDASAEFAASLRGKKTAYLEAEAMVDRVLRGEAIRKPSWVRRSIRAFKDSRAKRRADDGETL